MNVHFMCAYYSQFAHTQLAPRSQQQWDSLKFTRAVKSGRINGYTTVPWASKPHERIDTSNVQRARQIFGFYVDQIVRETGSGDVAIIPVPSKDGLVDATDYRSFQMVREALAETSLANRVQPILRFTAQMERAAAGGTRDRGTLAANMRLTHYPQGERVIIVDDIITTGGSLLASYDVLAQWQHPPHLAICCAHTVSDSLTKAFGLHMREYDPAPGQI